MTRSIRGAVLIETAIIIAAVLLVLFGVIQLAILGFTQAATTGAAFIGAHAASVNSSGSAGTDQSYAQSVVKGPFPSLSPNLVLTYPSANVIQVVVATNAGGLLLVPGAPSTIGVQGDDLEPILANTASTTSTSTVFAARATLANYCYFQGAKASCNAAQPLYVAQYDNVNGNGNGNHGQFAEWICRPALFPAFGSTYFPTTYPTGKGGSGSIYDPASRTFGEASLYAFDTSSKWDTQSSC